MRPVTARLATLLLLTAASLPASAVAVTATGVEAYWLAFTGLKEQFPDIQLIDYSNEAAVRASLAGGKFHSRCHRR